MTKAFLATATIGLMSKGTFDFSNNSFVSALQNFTGEIEVAVIKEATQFIEDNSSAKELFVVVGNHGAAIKGMGIKKRYFGGVDVETAIADMTASEYCSNELAAEVDKFARAIYKALDAKQKIEFKKASTLYRWEIIPTELADKTLTSITFKHGESEDKTWYCDENKKLTGHYEVYEFSKGRFAVPRCFKGTGPDDKEVILEAFEAVKPNKIRWDKSDHMTLNLLEILKHLPKLEETRQSLFN